MIKGREEFVEKKGHTIKRGEIGGGEMKIVGVVNEMVEVGDTGRKAVNRRVERREDVTRETVEIGEVFREIIMGAIERRGEGVKIVKEGGEVFKTVFEMNVGTIGGNVKLTIKFVKVEASRERELLGIIVVTDETKGGTVREADNALIIVIDGVLRSRAPERKGDIRDGVIERAEGGDGVG